MVSSALLEVPTGLYSDRIGRKNTIVAGAFCALVSATFYAIGLNFWILAVGAVFHGACKAFFSGNNDAYLHNLLTSENLQEHYPHYRGKLESRYMLGTSLGALIGGFLANSSFTALMWVSLLPLSLAFLISLKLKSLPPLPGKNSNILAHLKEAIIEVKNNTNLRILSANRILGSALGETASQFQPVVYQVFWPLWAVGLARAVAEWVAIPGTYFSGRLINKIGSYKVLILSNFYSWFSNFIAVLIPSKFTPAIISSSAIFWGPGEVAEISIFQQEFTEKQRATIASLNSFLSSLLFAVVAYFAGMIADSFGPVKALLVIQLLILPTLILDWKLYRRNR